MSYCRDAIFVQKSFLPIIYLGKRARWRLSNIILFAKYESFRKKWLKKYKCLQQELFQLKWGWLKEIISWRNECFYLIRRHVRRLKQRVNCWPKAIGLKRYALNIHTQFATCAVNLRHIMCEMHDVSVLH